MHTVFNIFYGVFIGLLVSIGALFLISIAPVELGIETKIVQSGSMEPAIPVGALVVIKPHEAYRVGDVITYGEDTDSAVPTTHRILGVREADGTVFYTTKGDANEEGDAREVARSDVIGKVYVSVPYVGFVLNFARQPLGFALLIALPAALVILSEFAAIVQEVRALWKRRGVAPKHPRRNMRLAQARRPYTVEYVRLFETDDIFMPVRIFESRGALQSSSHRPATLSSTLAVLSVMVLTWYGTSGTLSYFRDTETSTGNMFTAGTWILNASLGGLGAGGGFATAFVEDVPEDTSDAEEVVDEDEPSEEIAQEEDGDTLKCNEASPHCISGGIEDEGEARVREGREDRDARLTP
ncbi:signal peptidase I [Candidatus Kaiserbacteria bacterium]|nr:signal peptidase I [Candidatus Kaiserbacteria bacterium]